MIGSELRSVRTLRPETAQPDPEPGGGEPFMWKVDRSTGQYGLGCLRSTEVWCEQSIDPVPFTSGWDVKGDGGDVQAALTYR